MALVGSCSHLGGRIQNLLKGRAGTPTGSSLRHRRALVNSPVAEAIVYRGQGSLEFRRDGLQLRSFHWETKATVGAQRMVALRAASRSACEAIIADACRPNTALLDPVSCAPDRPSMIGSRSRSSGRRVRLAHVVLRLALLPPLHPWSSGSLASRLRLLRSAVAHHGTDPRCAGDCASPPVRSPFSPYRMTASNPRVRLRTYRAWRGTPPVDRRSSAGPAPISVLGDAGVWADGDRPLSQSYDSPT